MSASDLELEIPLKKPILLHVVMFVFLSGLGLGVLLVPRKPGRGANLGPGIHLNDETAGVVVPILGALILLIGLFILWSLIMLARRKRFAVRATRKWLEVPGPAWSPDLQRIDWSRVLDISRGDDGSVRVSLDRGRAIAWPQGWFVSADAAREAHFSLKERMAEAHQRIGKKLAT
jgi:hypothetical protein